MSETVAINMRILAATRDEMKSRAAEGHRTMTGYLLWLHDEHERSLATEANRTEE